jgi:ADP-heptose:LPS heptosyltransferase
MLSIRVRIFFSLMLQRIKMFSKNRRLSKNIENEIKEIGNMPLNTKNKAGTLIVKCDDIGDFILWQHTIEHFKEKASRPFYFVGNKVLQEYYETAFPFADKAIWIDKSKWKEADYRQSMYNEVASFNAEIAITTCFTRNLFLDDMLILSSQASQKIAWSMKHHIYYQTWLQQDNFLTQVIESENIHLLEYFRNIEFVEKVYNYSIPKEITTIKNPVKKNQLIIVPLASVPSKSWGVENIIATIQQIDLHFEKIILVGGPDAVAACTEIEKSIQNNKIINLANKTSLSELFDLIAQSKLVISPDTAAMHMAILSKTPLIAIANGTMWQRFTNYQPYVNSFYKLITPPHVSMQENKLKIHFTRAEINEITIVEVVNAVNTFLN